MTIHLLLFYDNLLLIRLFGSVSSVVYYEKSGGKMVHVLSLSSRQGFFFLGIYKQEAVKVKQERCFYILSSLKFRVSSECFNT